MSKFFGFFFSYNSKNFLNVKNSDIANEPKCQIGVPLPNVFCGRGPNRQDCPRGYSCNIHPTDRYAVCCRNRRKAFKLLLSKFLYQNNVLSS